MITDALLNVLVPIGTNQSLVAGAGVSIPSVGTLDLLGAGVGVAPPNIIGNATVFGQDSGINAVPPSLIVTLADALATSNSATLTIAVQGAVDSGSGGGYMPGTWQTFEQSPAITAAQGTAGARVFRLPFPPAFPSSMRPRFIRLLFIVPSATNFTAGSVGSAIITRSPDEHSNRYAPRNYVVA